MRQANALGIPYVVVLGEDEIQRGEVLVRNMRDSTQETRPMTEFLESLAAAG
jgi:histidyl-tRNA synthetase